MHPIHQVAFTAPLRVGPVAIFPMPQAQRTMLDYMTVVSLHQRQLDSDLKAPQTGSVARRPPQDFIFDAVGVDRVAALLLDRLHRSHPTPVPHESAYRKLKVLRPGNRS